MDPSDAPTFLDGTFLWDENGYSFASPPPRSLSTVDPRNEKEPWFALAAILESAKAGSHSAIDNIALWPLTEKDVGLQQSALALIGDAGTQAQVNGLTEVMLHADWDYIKVKACEAAAHAGYIWLVRDILRTWQAVKRTEKESVSLSLSWTLDAPGCTDAFDYVRFDEDHEYVAFIEARTREVERSYGLEAVICQGGPLDVGLLVKEMLDLVRKPPGPAQAKVSVLRHRFEAMTGTDCRSFFKNDDVQPLAAAAVLERFLESGEATRYTPGVRYFFGHPIP